MFFKLFLLCDSETKNKGKNNWVCARDFIKSKELFKKLLFKSTNHNLGFNHHINSVQIGAFFKMENFFLEQWVYF